MINKRSQYYLIFAVIMMSLFFSLFFIDKKIINYDDNLDKLLYLIKNYKDNIDILIITTIANNQSIRDNLLNFDGWFFNNSVKNDPYYAYFIYLNNFYENNLVIINHLKSNITIDLFCSNSISSFNQSFILYYNDFQIVNNTNGYSCYINISYIINDKIYNLNNINTTFNNAVIIYYFYDYAREEIIIKQE